LTAQRLDDFRPSLANLDGGWPLTDEARGVVGVKRRAASGARRVFAGQRLFGSGVTEDGRERDPYPVTDYCHDGEGYTQNRDEFQWTSLHLGGSAQLAQSARLVRDAECLEAIELSV
jgi:hypothetical protein